MWWAFDDWTLQVRIVVTDRLCLHLLLRYFPQSISDCSGIPPQTQQSRAFHRDVADFENDAIRRFTQFPNEAIHAGLSLTQSQRRRMTQRLHDIRQSQCCRRNQQFSGFETRRGSQHPGLTFNQSEHAILVRRKLGLIGSDR